MKFTIEIQEEKPLVERIEVIMKIEDFEVTPSNSQVQEEIAKQLNKPAELIIMKKIHQKFGKSEAKAFAYIYNSQEALKKFETNPKKKKVRSGEKPAEKPVEKPAEKDQSKEVKSQEPEKAEKS